VAPLGGEYEAGNAFPARRAAPVAEALVLQKGFDRDLPD
jgi:hypothetical protein